MLALEERVASHGEAKALKIPAGEMVCAYRGLSLSDEQPIAAFESLFPLSRLAGITAALQDTSSVTRALKAVGVSDYTSATTRLTATCTTAPQALHLQVAEGDPLLRSSSVNVDEAGEPVEYGRSWFAGDRITLTLER